MYRILVKQTKSEQQVDQHTPHFAERSEKAFYLFKEKREILVSQHFVCREKKLISFEIVKLNIFYFIAVNNGLSLKDSAMRTIQIPFKVIS